MQDLILSTKVGFFLATRDIRNNNIWTTILIIFIMALTFLNLVVVRGVLVGLTVGASDANRILDSGDVLISAQDENPYIEDSPHILAIVESLEQAEAVSARYKGSATLEANYKTRTNEDTVANTIGVGLTGIKPSAEKKLSGIDSYIVEGRFLDDNDVDAIVIDRSILKEFNPDQVGLENVSVGTKVRLSIHGNVREVVVKGITKAKSQAIQQSIYMHESVVQQLLDRNDFGRDEIAMRVKEHVDPEAFKQILIAHDIDNSAKIQYWLEAQLKFLKDITATFSLIGNLIGSIALVVAAITIFIIIFVNAITRRRYIGIMKGIGIHSRAIIISYVMQAIFYAIIGTSLSMVFIYTFLLPYFIENPIDFPFSDGIIVAELSSTTIRAVLLLIATIIAGYVPARMIVRKNTLDSILGR